MISTTNPQYRFRFGIITQDPVPNMGQICQEMTNLCNKGLTRNT